MRIKPPQRKKLENYLKEFYNYYPNEKYTVLHFVKYFKRRLKDNKDAWMGVSGDTGSGKSFFVLMCQILFGRPFSLIDNVSYIPKGNEIVDKFQKLKFQTFLVDEAAKEMRSVNWQSKEQQNVNTAAMTERYKNNWVFLNMPNFNEFTKSMRVSNILFRAIIPYRTAKFARVFIQRKSRNWRDSDPWADKFADEKYQKIQRRYKEISNDHIDSIERGLPNYVMDFIVPNLALILPEVAETYENLKIQSRIVNQDNLTSEKEKRNIWKNKYQDFMVKFTLFLNSHIVGKDKMSKKAVCHDLGISTETFNKYLNKPHGDSAKSMFHKNLLKEKES